MPVYVRNTGTWRQSPTDNTRTMWVRGTAVWHQALDVWVRDQGAWHKEPGYSAVFNQPTNLRMNPADANNHSSIPVAWDWSGVLLPDDFQLVLTNEAGGWLQNLSIAADQRSYTFTSLSTNTRYRVYIRARRSGRTDDNTAFLGPLNWFVGADSYDAHNGPVYGWSSNEVWYSPYSGYSWASSEQVGWPATAAIDGSDSTRWITADVPGAPSAAQGEGIRFYLPAVHGTPRLFTGVHIYSNGYTYCWLSFWMNGAWQGSVYPYSGKYTPLNHAYLGAAGGDASSSGSSGYYYYVRNGEAFNGAWDISTYTGSTPPFVDCLFQHNTPGQANIEIWEIKALLYDWVVVANNASNIIAAVNSGSW